MGNLLLGANPQTGRREDRGQQTTETYEEVHAFKHPSQRCHTINMHAYRHTYILEQTGISTQAKKELSGHEKDLWIRIAEPLGGLAEAQLSGTEIRFAFEGY